MTERIYTFDGPRMADYCQVTTTTGDRVVNAGDSLTQAEVDSLTPASKADLRRWQREGVLTVTAGTPAAEPAPSDTAPVKRGKE